MLKWVAVMVAVLGASAGSLVIFIAVRGIPSYDHPAIQFRMQSTPEMVAHGRKLVRLLCMDCHFDPASRALTGKRMRDVPAKFGTIFAPNITQDATNGIGSWSDGELAFLFRTGIRRDGRYEPPYMIKLPNASDDDIAAIIAFLRSDDVMVKASAVASHPQEPTFLVKMLCYFAFRPLPYPSKPVGAPPKTNRVAYGRYLANGLLDCYSCHSADFQTNNPLQPERSAHFYGGGNLFRSAENSTIESPNITADVMTGIGSWSEEQFVNALRRGFRPDRSPVRYPMPRYVELEDDESAAIFAYLRTVPILVGPHRHQEVTMILNGSVGQRVYEKYGCGGCHGKAGDGPIDLRRATKKFTTDERLTAFLKHPADIDPGNQMPAFEGIVAAEDYTPLVAHIRSLQIDK
jgi:cytochrome c2